MTKQTILTPANITWQDTTPVSVSFQDFYFSTDDGLNESRYVFLNSNNLPTRFTQGDINQPFVVSETGFGTGLNFLITWQAWQQLDSPKRPLHFFSVEKSPLKIQDLIKALENWPEIKPLAQSLIEQYPPMVTGLHTLDFDNGQVRLSLLFGDINTELSKVSFQTDAWFLDGFSPKKNPEMWSDDFFQLIAKKSQEGTSFATFTSASGVRRSLENVGFTTQKQQGFGKKREMLLGFFSTSLEKAQPSKQIKAAPLWSYPQQQNSFPQDRTHPQHNPDYDVAIIGAGISGLASAYELAQQGLKVCIIDKNNGPVKGASGQTQLAMYVKLPSEANKLFKFIIQALNGSMRFYNSLQQANNNAQENRFWHQTGLMQLAWNDKERTKLDNFIKNIQLPEDIICMIDEKAASEKSGLNIACRALWFEKSGWLDPIIYSRAILKTSNIDTLFQHKISALNFNEQQQAWHLTEENNIRNISARFVVIASANDAKRFEQLSHLPSKPLRGQVTSIKQNGLTGSKTIVCGEGYLCPPVNDWHHFGATFDLKCDEPIIKESDAKQNINSLNTWLPNWLPNNSLKQAEFHHSAGLRCTTPDYLPIVGQAPIASKMIDEFAKLRVDANACNTQHGSYYPNLFVNLGHGSKGLFTTPLAAQIIRYHICGGLPPCIDEHRVMLSPARFIIKHLIQRRL